MNSDENANELENNLNRIIRVRDADLGLFVLAMHSLMERTLKEKYNSQDDFGQLINRYTDDFYQSHGEPSKYNPDKRIFSDDEWKLFKTLKNIYTNHFLSNDVRHKFAQIQTEEAQVTAKYFLAFAQAEGWKNHKALSELQKELAGWEAHNPYQSEDLTKAINQIEKLKKENENLAQKANDYNELKNQLSILTAREKLLESSLKENEERLSKKDARLNEIRQKANEQAMGYKKEKEEILLKMKDFESTKKYLSYLEKVSFYTKTRHDYESSLIKLSPEQNDILNQINADKDFLVKGAAGTGKSLVLIKALEKAVKNANLELDIAKSGTQFRLLTYTKSLVKYNQYVTKILNTQIPENYITTADSFLFQILKHFYPNKSFSFNYEDFKNLFSRELYNEANEFIWANCITRELYIDQMCDRSGMKTPLQKEDRISMWEEIQKAEAALEEKNLWPRNFAAKKISEAMRKALENGETDFCADYSFVDEAQDLPPVILSIIKLSTKRGVFLAGDSDQSIYRKGFNWNLSGIDIRGRTKILKTNFRNTNQIHDFAEKYRAKFKNMDKETSPAAFRPGPPVEITEGKDTDDLMHQMVQQVKLLLNVLGYEEENICIIANQKQKLETIKNLLDHEIGIKSNLIEDSFDFAQTEGIRLCTMQKCKGLDFPVVLFLADHRLRGFEANSAFDSETLNEQQYNMVYVCLTRAMEMLHIYTAKNTSFQPFLDLRKIQE